MLRTRFFKLISLVLVAAMLLLGFGYWWMRRSLPVESGQVRLPLQANVTVTRDGLGVPTVRGQSLADLYMAQGFVTAQDRLWQMDALRRSASGRLAEVIGRSMVARDIETRTLGMDRLAERFTTLLTARDRQLLEAYATGVNAYMNQAAALPPEFAVLGYQPEPWRPTDTILVALEMMRTLTNSWRRDVTRGQLQHLLAEGGPQRLLPEVVIPGSNAWVLSGKHTASGQAMLANDPHLAFGQPGIWYMTELVGARHQGAATAYERLYDSRNRRHCHRQKRRDRLGDHQPTLRPAGCLSGRAGRSDRKVHKRRHAAAGPTARVHRKGEGRSGASRLFLGDASRARDGHGEAGWAYG